MKTSLARTFLDFQEGWDSQDLIFPARPTSRSITSDPATPITPESLFVIKPYVERYAGGGTSTLLVNPKLRNETVLSRHGIDIPRQTLARWVIQCSELFQPLLNLMRDRLLEVRSLTAMKPVFIYLKSRIEKRR